MSVYILTEVEQKLIEKYQQTKDENIALYFYNKLGKEVLSVIYSKINHKFTMMPFEKEDLSAIVWDSLKNGLAKCKNQSKKGLWNLWISDCYFGSIREIRKYYSNSELTLNYADSWEELEQTHLVLSRIKSLVEEPKQNIKDVLEPIIDYVSTHNKTYAKSSIKRLLYLKSLGYSDREIAKKMHVSRRYIASMVKIILRISKRYLSASNR